MWRDDVVSPTKIPAKREEPGNNIEELASLIQCHQQV